MRVHDRHLECVGCSGATIHTFSHALTDRHGELRWYRCTVCGMPRSLDLEEPETEDIYADVYTDLGVGG